VSQARRLQTSHPAGRSSQPLSRIRDGRVPGGRHHSVKTVALHHAEQRRRPLGLAGSVVATAIGYLLPKLIGQMTPGGVIPSSIPASISGFMTGAPRQTTTTHRVEQVAPRAINVIHDAPHLGRWLIPLLAGLGVLGLFWYLLSGNYAGTGGGDSPGSGRLAVSADTVDTGSPRAHQ
jgi:hypothetical protein